MANYRSHGHLTMKVLEVEFGNYCSVKDLSYDTKAPENGYLHFSPPSDTNHLTGHGNLVPPDLPVSPLSLILCDLHYLHSTSCQLFLRLTPVTTLLIYLLLETSPVPLCLSSLLLQLKCEEGGRLSEQRLQLGIFYLCSEDIGSLFPKLDHPSGLFKLSE